MSYDQFKYQFSINPIILVQGAASAMPGARLSIVSFLQSDYFLSGPTGTAFNSNYDDYFAQFEVMPGGTLVSNQYGEYPFANIAVAANAVITQPLTVSLLMTAPVKSQGGYAAKLALMTSLQAALANHVNQGGTFDVLTPSYYYRDLVLLGLRDVSGGSTKQTQVQWQWDFRQPLVTSVAAQGAQNSLMQRMQAQTMVVGDPPSYSGPQTAVGLSQSSVSSSVAPSTSISQPSFGR